MVDELVSRFGALGLPADELTLVYDAGQDSKKNQTKMAESPLHFVGSLPPSDHLELMAVSRRRYRVVNEEAFPASPPLRAAPAPLVASTGRGHPFAEPARLTAPGL